MNNGAANVDHVPRPHRQLRGSGNTGRTPDREREEAFDHHEQHLHTRVPEPAPRRAPHDPIEPPAPLGITYLREPAVDEHGAVEHEEQGEHQPREKRNPAVRGGAQHLGRRPTGQALRDHVDETFDPLGEVDLLQQF